MSTRCSWTEPFRFKIYGGARSIAFFLHDFIQWMVGRPVDVSQAAAESSEDQLHRDRWLTQPRMSAHELAQSVNLIRVYKQLAKFRMAVLPLMAEHAMKSVFYKLDLTDTAKNLAKSEAPAPAASIVEDDLMLAVHNLQARFVKMSLSSTVLRVTKS